MGRAGHTDVISPRTLRSSSLASVAVIAASLVASVPLAAIYLQGPKTYDLTEWVIGIFAPAFALSGWWLTTRRPRLVVGWLFMAAGVTVALATLASAWAAAAWTRGWPGVAWSRWVVSWMWQPQMTLPPLAFLLFPDGVVRGRLHRVLLGAVGGVMALSMLVSAVRPGFIVTSPNNTGADVLPVANPLGIGGLDGVLDGMAGALSVGRVVGGIIPLLWVAWWWRRSEGVRRKQFRWATWIRLSGALVVPIALLAPDVVGPLAILQTIASQILVAVAILQWRAYGVDVVLRRSVLAVCLVAAALGTYAAVVLVVSVGLGRSGPVSGAVGAMVAIFAFGPMSSWIRSSINRAFYGRRDDPFAVVSELGGRLSGAGDPSEGLAAVVAALCDQLKLPFAEIRNGEGAVLARRGEPEVADEPRELTLSHQGRDVGQLRVGHRRGSSTFSTEEEQLLVTLSQQIGAAVTALDLVEGLRGAQERLVVATQDERRRIQRDLHDELTPQLTGVTFKLDAARNHLDAGNTGQVDELVASARNDVNAAVADMRRLVYALGDPTVASLGLGPAVVDRVRALALPAGITVDCTIADDLPVLPPAVEEAVLRIVTEAVANVVRHAGATRCLVEVGTGTDGAELVARIADNGRGIGAGSRPGVGTSSMRDRATQLGGRLDVGPADGGGTVVVAVLPLRSAR